MLARIYALMWFLVAGTTAGLYFGGHLNDHTLTVVFFFTATLVFIGMSILLPSSVSQRSAQGY
jgi:hypothetical protein